MTGLKAVALISGGKDSLFSILHCLANGHEVIALANLRPPSQPGHAAAEDMDSYMYQTIGHAIIPLYEEALDLPLYRQEILGYAVNQNKNYGMSHLEHTDAQDETESLVPLLLRVKAAHPEVNAVSTGAILSDYQRTRVESVALRLGLTPLSYLWQWPSLPPCSQRSLLDDMDAVGQDARIIKVASGGLDESFLWQNVADQRTIARLVKASQKFGNEDDGAVLGEGGEYETLTLSGPAPLWKGSIVVEEGDVSFVNGEAGSASVQLANAKLEERGTGQVDGTTPRIPGIWESYSEVILQELLTLNEEDSAVTGIISDDLPLIVATASTTSGVLQDRNELFISDVTGNGLTTAMQMESIMSQLKGALELHGHQFLDVAYCSIILRHMDHFADMNAIYGKSFTHPNPPSRVTLACAEVLEPGQLLKVSVTSVQAKDSGDRRGLHVQSRSYWAPANIGPYSQAITVRYYERSGADDGYLIYVAGQIPLVPASMELFQGPSGQLREYFRLQAVLALQHLVRIGNTTGVRRWLACVAFVTADSSEEAKSRGRLARRAWKALHDPPPTENQESLEADDFDVWDVNNRSSHSNFSTPQIRPTERAAGVPPLWVFRVDSLPRRSSIEWVAYGSTAASGRDVAIPHLHHLLSTFRSCML